MKIVMKMADIPYYLHNGGYNQARDREHSVTGTLANEAITMTNNDTKKQPAISATIDGTKMTLTFSNGATLNLDATHLHDDIRQHAIMHGLKQKLVDAAAISRNTETGRPASVNDKYEAVKTVYDRLLSGAWNAIREGGGTGGLLLQALCHIHADRKTPEQIREWLETKTDAEKTALRKNPKVASIIEELRAAAGKSYDTGLSDDLLAELDDGEDALKYDDERNDEEDHDE